MFANKITNHQFLNAMRSLSNIDHHLLPELSLEQWKEFQENPYRYVIRADKRQSDAILREVERRGN